MGDRPFRLAPLGASLSVLALAACASTGGGPPVSQPPETPPGTLPATPPLTPPTPFDSISMFDAARSREIPVALYHPPLATPGVKPPLAILSHGNGSQNTYYSFIASALTARGYLVASIQQQLASDPPIAMSGDIYAERFPSWELGEANIDYVMRTLNGEGLVDLVPGAVLIGHSHGGDISMLFTRDYPERVRAAISLDNLRMPLPRTRFPQICSIRASDTKADDGVLPSDEETAYYGIRIVKIEGLKHGDMQDWAEPQYKQAMIDAINQCLDAGPVG